MSINIHKIIKNIFAITLSLALLSTSIFTVNYSKFNIESNATGENQQEDFFNSEFWNYYDTLNKVFPYVDFTPFQDSSLQTYQINSAEQMAGLSVLVNSASREGSPVTAGNGTTAQVSNFKDKTIELNQDINLSAHKWVPIGYDEIFIFKGNFNAKEKTISNIKIENNKPYKYAGLFGYIMGTLENINIANSSISLVDPVYTGAIAGKCMKGSIINCKTDRNSKIMCSFSNSTMNFSAGVGGIVGYTYSGKIEDCKNYLDISTIKDNNRMLTSVYVGGISGNSNSSAIKRCANTASIRNHVHADCVGGIIGYCVYRNELESCVNMKDIRPINAHTGGIIGEAFEHQLKLTNCINTGVIQTSKDSIQMYYEGAMLGKYSDILHNDMSNVILESCSHEGIQSLKYIGNKVD